MLKRRIQLFPNLEVTVVLKHLKIVCKRCTFTRDDKAVTPSFFAIIVVNPKTFSM